MTSYLLFILLQLLQTTETAPDIKLMDSMGEVHHLYDYKGQVIYVSLWASWCKPCLNNYKKYKKVREQLAAEGVLLLNVSIDEDEVKWRAALEKNEDLIGSNFLAADVKKVMRNYELTKVPDYHIIDKSGNFVFLSDAPDRNILEEFRGWLR